MRWPPGWSLTGSASGFRASGENAVKSPPMQLAQEAGSIDWRTVAMTAGAIITTLAGLLVCAVIWFLLLIHRDLRKLRDDLTTLIQELPEKYVKLANYDKDRRHFSEGIRYIHKKIDAVRDGKPTPQREESDE